MLKLIPLGGLGEIGLNMMALECDDQILVVDSGLMFPEEYMPGVDVVIPDIQYLRDNRERVKWIVLTHGHEDHIGAMPFLLREFNLPVFGTSFTIELLKEKLREHNLLQNALLHKVNDPVPGEIMVGALAALDAPGPVQHHLGGDKLRVIVAGREELPRVREDGVPADHVHGGQPRGEAGQSRQAV